MEPKIELTQDQRAVLKAVANGEGKWVKFTTDDIELWHEQGVDIARIAYVLDMKGLIEINPKAGYCIFTARLTDKGRAEL